MIRLQSRKPTINRLHGEPTIGGLQQTNYIGKPANGSHRWKYWIRMNDWQAMKIVIDTGCNLLEMVRKATPHMMLQIQPSRQRKVVRNWKRATQELTQRMLDLSRVLGRGLEQHNTDRPDTNVPAGHKKHCFNCSLDQFFPYFIIWINSFLILPRHLWSCELEPRHKASLYHHCFKCMFYELVQNSCSPAQSWE